MPLCACVKFPLCYDGRVRLFEIFSLTAAHVQSTLSIEVLEADDHRERERNSLEVISQAAIARASSEVLERQQFVVGSVHDERLDDETARLVSMDVSTPPRRGLSLSLNAFEMRDDKAHTSLGFTLARVLTSTAVGTSQESIRSQIEGVLQDWVWYVDSLFHSAFVCVA